MAITDIVTFVLSIFFVIRGSSRGFMNSLIVPFSIIVATIFSVMYYQINNQVIVSLLIGLIGPVVLYLLLKSCLKVLAKLTNTEIKPNFLSRVGGSILTLVWGWVFIVFTLILLNVLPPWGKTLTAIHNDVTKSFSFYMAKPLGEKFFTVPKQNIPAASSNTALADTKSLAEDPRFQEILQDPEIQKEIDAHDIVKLMSNPKMIALTQQIMSDPATMKKIMAIYSHQAQPQGFFANTKPSSN